MSSTTTQERTTRAPEMPSPAASAGQARAAWATALRDAEPGRWNALYDRAVPAPQTAMTVWERHAAGWPARDADELARYRELDACSPRHGTEIEAAQ
jgi:hypothetical protein